MNGGNIMTATIKPELTRESRFFATSKGIKDLKEVLGAFLKENDGQPADAPVIDYLHRSIELLLTPESTLKISVSDDYCLIRDGNHKEDIFDTFIQFFDLYIGCYFELIINTGQSFKIQVTD